MIPQSHRIPLVADFRFIHEPLPDAHQVPPAFFVGRDSDLNDLCTRLLFSAGGAFLVTGYRGVGKTSFVNQAISRLRLALADPRQQRRDLVDVQLNLARSVTPVELIHYMVRALRQRLIETGIFARLEPSLAAEVELAFLRTSFSVAYRYSGSVERSLAADFKLPALSLGPSFALTAKRTNQLGRDLSCLAYDEKTAEYDLLRLSHRLTSGYVRRARWRWPWRRQQRVELKLLFVCDELDKLEAAAEAGQTTGLDTVFSTLKNFFTASGISFIFIAGKDLQERWLEEVGRGDSIYESIFTYVKYLRTLDCGDRICDAFLAGEHVASEEAADTCQLFKKYLAFKGRGIPRRILRSFNEYVTWNGDGAGLEFSPADLRQFRFYSGLLDHLRANEGQLVDPFAAEEASGLVDQRRLGLYYLCDWILSHGDSEFSLEEAILATRQFSRLIAPGESVAPGMVTRLLAVLAAGEYVEEINRLLAIEVGATAPQAVKRYRLAARRAAEMGRQAKGVERAAELLLANAEARPLIAGRYQIGREVGRGAMSAVYEGTDTQTGLHVAVKVLDRAFMADPVMVARFRREVAVLSRLQFPDVVRILDHGVSDTEAFIVMEFLEGVLLQNLVDLGTTSDLDVSLAIARDLLQALGHIHAQGVLWRDPKPGNVMITSEGRLVIIDFGISREALDERQLTRAGNILGTPEYMSPEQATGGSIDARSDLFAFGAVLYEMITGERPFRGQSFAMIILQVVSVDPPPPSSLRAVPPEIDALLLRCLAKRPDDRPQSADEILAALPVPRGAVDLGTVVRSASALAVQQARERRRDTAVAPRSTTLLELPAPGGSRERDVDAPVLVVAVGEESWRYVLTADRYSIGRGRDCDITVAAASVSRRHAELIRTEGGYGIRDLNTANGLWLNGERVHDEAELDDDAVITIGHDCAMRYLAPSSPGGNVPAPCPTLGVGTLAPHPLEPPRAPLPPPSHP
jgi:predicted Ser/Thr protein kinase